MSTARRDWLRKYFIPLLWTAAIVYTIAFALNFRTRGLSSIIWSDAEGYYMYLPAVFIYDGFEDIPVLTSTSQFRNYPGTNKIFDKYTCGLAFLELPFFLGAHAYASISEQYPANGHAPPYIYALILAGLCYGFLGTWLLRLNLREHFPGIVPDIVAISVLMGTNLLHYSARAPGMSHVYSFFLFNLFIWLTHRYYRQSGSWKTAIGLALVLAWTILIRPTNILLGLYFLAYTSSGQLSLSERFHFLKKRIGHLLLFPLFGFLAFIPQMMYWHYMTGSYLFYSYRDESFIYWDNPKLLPVLFAIKNGWLLFTPLMGIALIGLLVGAFKRLHNSRVILLIFLVAWYAFASWKSWWFGGAFGHRAFIEFYALLAFPLAMVMQWILQRKYLLPKILFFLLWVILVYYNLGLDEHYVGPHYDWREWKLAMEMMFTF